MNLPEAVTTSAAATQSLAGALAGLAVPGDLVLLAGDLGAGKTTFAQGFGAALGVAEPVVSPTFTLLRTYHGRLTLNHADVYRLDHLQEITDLGLPELLEGAVTLVEWGDMAAPALPSDFLEVRLGHPTLDEPDDQRRVGLRIVGPGWAPRRRALHEAIAPWVGS